MLELYRNIKKRRMECGITQTELAKLVGYADKGMISRVEAGLVDLPYAKIESFAKALHTKPSDLMGWEDALESANTDIITDIAIDKAKQDIVEKLFSLSESDYDMVCAMINRCAKEEGTT